MQVDMSMFCNIEFIGCISSFHSVWCGCPSEAAKGLLIVIQYCTSRYHDYADLLQDYFQIWINVLG